MAAYEYNPRPLRKATPAFLATTQDPEFGDGEVKQKANILGDLLDVLSRPARASAQAVYNATDDNASTGAGAGFLQGLKGQGGVTYKNVLEDNFGVENKWVSTIGGFVGDVALDPLSYVGVKPTKGVGSTEALLKAVSTGADDIALEAERIMAANPSKIALTVAGKPLGSGKTVGALKVPAQVRRATEKLLGPAGDKALLPRMFSRDAELTPALNQLERVAESSNSAMFDSFRRQMKSLYTGLSSDEQRRVALALDKGETLVEGVLAPDKTKFANLQDYVTTSRKLLDDFFVEEGKLGLFTPKAGTKGLSAADFEEYNPNYVYRYFKKPPKNLELGTEVIETKIGGTNRSDFMKKRKADVSIEEAEQLGYDPLNTIQDIMDMRAFKHFRTVSRGSFVRDGIDQFAINGQQLKQLKGKQLEGLKWVPADSVDSPVAKQMGSDKYIPSFIAKAINMSENTFRVGSTGNDVMRLYDKALNQWKFYNTAVMPGFHIRNTMSDVIMNAADGVWNPQRYGQAAKVMADRKAVVDRQLAQMLDPDSTITAFDTARKSRATGVKLGGKTISSDEVWDLYGKSGAKSGLITSEFQRSLTDFQKKGLADRYKKGQALIGDVADNREDWIRMAHFIDATDSILKKSKKPMSVEAAAMEAGQRVRKYNIDYGNLSTFERNVMKRIVPFYTWMRKATPLNMELLFTKPGFMALYPKGQDLTQGLLGTDDGTGETLVPEWIKDSAPVRVALARQAARNPLQQLLAGAVGAGDNESVFLRTEGLAPMATLQYPGNLLKNLAQGDIMGVGKAVSDPFAGQFTPAIKAPMELVTGRSMFNNQPIGGPVDWLSSQGAAFNTANRVVSGEGGSNLMSALTGAQLTASTASRQEGEFRRRQDLGTEKKKSEKEELLRKRFSNYDELTEADKERLRSRVRTRPDPIERAQRKYLTQILGQ